MARTAGLHPQQRNLQLRRCTYYARSTINLATAHIEPPSSASPPAARLLGRGTKSPHCARVQPVAYFHLFAKSSGNGNNIWEKV